jgi:protein gp37
MNKTKIEYLTRTWNPLVGCSGEGCAVKAKCWAASTAKRFHRACGLFVPHFHPERLEDPELFAADYGRHIVGCCFMGDFFDRLMLNAWQEQVLDTIEKARQHHFIILTKQPQNIAAWIRFPMNLSIGVSVNKAGDIWRIRELAKRNNIHHRIISAEPLYEDLGDIAKELREAMIEWMIIGAQTRPTVLPEMPWIHRLLMQCWRLSIPTFMKNNLTNWPHLSKEYPPVLKTLVSKTAG